MIHIQMLLFSDSDIALSSVCLLAVSERIFRLFVFEVELAQCRVCRGRFNGFNEPIDHSEVESHSCSMSISG